jgi:pSer/pThr/pTyr-binding forkhead associated (FHA) protein
LSPVKDPIISKFAEACDATAPLDLRVDLADGGRAAEGSVPMPFTLVGRDDACDVTLADAEVNPRHAWLQVVAGRVLAVDLGSRTGLRWPGQATGSGWLDVGTPVQIGPFHLRICSPVSSRPGHFPLGYSPLQSDNAIGRTRPTATLEFRNGKRAKDRWAVNRLVTLVGRAPECKIRLSADDIAGYHCGLILTPEGLWVVDLSGRGVVVNGERMRVSPLRHGAELWVGRFLIGLHYPAPTPPAGSARPATAATASAPPASASKQTVATTTATTVIPAPGLKESPEDEVPIGVAPHADVLAGLPSSHIMADAFRLWAAVPAGSISNPILVSGSGAIAGSGSPPAQSPLLDLLSAVRLPSGQAGAAAAPLGAATEAVVVSLLRELGDLHSQMLTHFQQSLVLMVQLFACLRRDQLPAMQRELARIQELNTELSQLQVELARRAAGEPPHAPSSPPHATPTPPASTTSPTPPPTQDSTALHNWVVDRINSIQRERQARWQSLVGMLSAPGQ